MTIDVDFPAASDRAAWEDLYRGYAEFYQVPMNRDILNTLWSWIGDAAHPVCGIIARHDASAVGFMHYRAMPSPLRGANIGFLDDLFVSPASRGLGVAEALFSRLREEGARNGWPCIRWITRDNNYRARVVYDRLSQRTDWVTYQMDL